MFSIDDCMMTARKFLETLCPPPWGVVAGGVSRNFSAKQLEPMAKLITQAYQQRQTIYTLMPQEEQTVWHLVVHAPRGMRAANMTPPPSMAITGREVTMIWTLSAPTSITEALMLSQKLATQAKGRAGVGEAIPLPGTIMFHNPGPMRLQRFPVSMMPTKNVAYRVADGKLVREAAKSSRPAYDARDLAIKIGEAPDGSEVVSLPGHQTNGFYLVLGASGSGKTETLKTLGAGVHRYGVPILLLDFHGDVILPDVASTLLSSAPSSRIGLNPLEVDVESAKENGLYDQRTAVLEMVRRAVPQLGHKQANALHTALENAYIAAGIDDNDPETWTRTAPTFPQIMAAIEDEGLLAGVRGLFGHPIFNRAEHLSIEQLLTRSMRLDLSKLPDGVRYVTAETLLRRIFTGLRMRGPIPVRPVDDSERFRLFIVIDEARLITMGGNSDIVSSLVNEARKFGLGLILASQMAEHFPADIRSNAATWLVLKPQAMEEAKRNAQNVAGVTPEQLMALRGRGDGYFRDRFTAEAQRVQVRPL